MSGLFGGSHAQSQIPTRYNGIQVAASSSGNAVPLIYGRQRLTFNLMWYGAFSSTASKSSSGGKGGGSQQTTGYTYKASFAAGICEGPISSIVNVWNDKDLTSLATLGFTLFTGASGQATWSYLTSNFSSQAIPYDHMCYVGAQNYSLGSSASMPNITFEVQGFLGLSGTAISFTGGLAEGATSGTLTSGSASALAASTTWNITFSDFEVQTCTVSGTAVQWTSGLLTACSATAYAGGVYDADPAAVILDYLTDPNHGVGFPSAQVSTLTGTNSYSSYCQALGITLSPMETTQRAASDFITEVMQMTNSDAVWSAGTLKIIPYADATVAGNGFSYTPNLTPVFIFTDDDFLDVPEVTRKATADTFNHVRVEYLDRVNQYNTAISESTDIGNIALTGERIMDTSSFHSITNSATARIVGQLMLQTSLYERNTIKFKIRADYSLLEPMDYIGICDPIKADGSGLGYGTINSIGVALTSQVFRVTKVTDDDKDAIEIEAMEVPGTVRSSALYNWAGMQGYNANFAQAPGSVQAPAFLEAYGVLVSPTGGRQLWIAACGPTGAASWGGCNVYMSFDGTTYSEIGIISAPAEYGTLNASLAASSADPDTTNTANVTLNNTLSTLTTGTAADAQENRQLIAVGSGSTVEVISYETATLVAAGQYGLTTLYRGLYGTLGQAHASGAQFMRLDGNIVSLDLDPGWMGQTLYFKFTSFNFVGRATESLSTVTAYTYVPGQSVSAYNSVSDSTWSASGSAVMYSPTSAFKNSTATTAWDSSVYSSQSYSNGCTIEAYASSIATGLSFMVGLALDPTASNSYTNLVAGLYATSGTLQIYENGTQVGTFGTYTTSDLLAIVYDGKHIAYYHNATLIRSVPDAGAIFFGQVCFLEPGAAVYGLSFDSATTAVTPFTMVPMTSSVACAGTKAIANNQDTTGQWGYRNFKTSESYNNGCQVSFNVTTTGAGAQFLGFSTAPATGASGGYGPVIAAWYPHGDVGTCTLLFNGAPLSTIAHAPIPSDVFTLTYDNFTFRWWLNGALQAQQYYPNAGALFLFGDMFGNYPTGFQNIAFEPYGQLSPNPFVVSGNCVTHDSTAIKQGGTPAWDSQVYSLNAYTTCHVQFKVSTPTLHVMLGLNQDPTTNASYTSIDCAWYAAAGTWDIYESGTAVATGIASVATTDLASITYDGTTVKYYLNGTLERSLTLAGVSLYMDSSFYDPGMSVNSLSFGPGVTLDSIPTASIDLAAITTPLVADNAVSTIASTQSATAVVLTGSHGTLVDKDFISLTVTTTGDPVEIDASCTANAYTSSGASLNPCNLQIYRDGSAVAGAAWDPTNSGTVGVSLATMPQGAQVTLTVTDTPAAGSHTYTLHGQATLQFASSGGGSLSCSNNFIKVREIKK